MKKTLSAIAAFLIVTLSAATLAPAAYTQRVTGDWTNVQTVGLDEELAITLKDGKKLRGDFSSANASELTIIRKKKQEVIAKDAVAYIYHVQRKAEKGKYAAIGAGIGAGTGLGIGAAKASKGYDDYEIYYVVGTALGAGIGAVGGLLFGAAKRKHVLIYQAP